MTKRVAPPTGRRGCYRHRCGNECESHASTQLTSCATQLVADDFKPGYHLEVGEPGSDRYQTSGRLEGTQATSLHPIPARGADHRKARRAAGPARAGFPDSEHIGTGGVSGYPAPTYLERIWGDTYVS